jgi:3'5'-cyclic nucleotide phosphodiesterase
MIHVSSTTAAKLGEAGLAGWLILRDDTPILKGKGALITYWLRNDEDGSHATSSTVGDDHNLDASHAGGLSLPLPTLQELRSEKELSGKVERLVQWTVQLLAHILQSVVARRLSERTRDSVQEAVQRKLAEHNGSMLAEVEEILALPQFDAKANRNQANPESVELPESVLSQLTSFVQKVASTYLDNPFHNVSSFGTAIDHYVGFSISARNSNLTILSFLLKFEHAAHVTMSVQKLLTRIVKPSDLHTGKQAKTAVELHDHTFGLTSDPLCQFAVVLSALIHDAGHPGVANSVLVEEKDPMATKYNSQSVAEQNSGKGSNLV